MFLLNSRSSLVTATPSNPLCYNSVHPGHPFSRSYGVNLPSSLTMVISHALVSSTCLPVSVCGTDSDQLTRGFSWQHEKPLRFTSLIHSLSAEVYVSSGFTYRTTPTPKHGQPIPCLVPQHCVTPLLKHWPLVKEYTPCVHRLRLSASP